MIGLSPFVVSVVRGSGLVILASLVASAAVTVAELGLGLACAAAARR